MTRVIASTSHLSKDDVITVIQSTHPKWRHWHRAELARPQPETTDRAKGDRMENAQMTALKC